MKKSILLLASFFVSAGFLGAQDAASIVRASRDRIQAATTVSQTRMVITSKGGGTRELLLAQVSKDGPRGKRTLIVFPAQNPSSVANTRFLTMENSGGADDRHIFLPSLGKVRRVASSEGSDSFMGTDLSYDDISSANRSADLDNHRILREENLGGSSCYVIESIPKDASYQYSKMIQWIGKDNGVTQKVELYDRRGNLVKILEVLELRNVQGRLSIISSKMSTIKAETSTTLQVTSLKYDDPVSEGVFTEYYLLNGRPQQ